MNHETLPAQGPVDVTVSLPWGDCKVAFDFDGGMDDVDALWDSLGTGEHKLPDGWSLSATSGEGARLVVIFRIDGDLRREDGEAVAAILHSIETAN